MKKNVGIWIGAGAIAVAILIVGVIAANGGDNSDTGSKASRSAAPTEKSESADRDPAPNISGETLDGKQASLKDFRGKPVVLQVFASWCEVCQAGAADISEVMKNNPNVQFIGLNVEDSPQDAKAFIAEYDWSPDAVIEDPNRQLENKLGLVGQPNTIVIDEKGSIVETIQGEASPNQLQNLIKQV